MTESVTRKRPLEHVGESSTHEILTKTERRRLAKKAKKEREAAAGVKAGKKGVGGVERAKGEKGSKPKMTKEERREKYTRKAYEARDQKVIHKNRGLNIRCLGCRKWGHVLAQCPDAKGTGICFNCGSKDHALRVCPTKKKQDGSLPHASCFVCGGKGHISAQCKQNANGIYPKGGSCKECGSKHHLWSQCSHREQKSSEEDPMDTDKDDKTLSSKDKHKATKVSKRAIKEGKELVEGREKKQKENKENEEEKQAPATSTSQGREKTNATVREWGGGDDLEDDDYFDLEDNGSQDELESKRSKGKGSTKVPSKLKRPKVVTF